MLQGRQAVRLAAALALLARATATARRSAPGIATMPTPRATPARPNCATGSTMTPTE